MKNLNTYVEELLYRHQCVIVPDFGAFVSNRKAAELTQDKMFSPPQKELTFNSRLTYNDGLLAKHISEVERISYEEAQEYIKSVANEWKEILQRGEELVFESLGSFTQGVNGNIVFEPSNKENYLTDSFGMSSFTPHQVNKEDETTPTAEGEAIENPIVTTEEAQAGKPKRKLPTLIKYAAVIVVAISAISYGVYAYFNNPLKGNENTIAQTADPAVVEDRLKEEISQASFLDENPIEIEDPVLIDNIKKDVKLAQRQAEEAKKKEKERLAAEAQAQRQAAAENKAKEKEEKTQTAAPQVTMSVSGGFHLIAGAFSSQQNAENRIKQLKQNGHNDASLVGKNAKGLFLVAYKSFNAKSDAEAYQTELKGKGLDTWVYSSK